eukprot:gene45618-56836_t
MELALELMSVTSDAELDQFLGGLFKGALKGLKKVGSAIGKVAKPLGGALKGIAKKALPFVGGALGSFIPIPGVGTAIGSALGGAVAKALELEFSGMEYEQQEFEMARRFVRIAGTAAQLAASSDGTPQAVRKALGEALVQHVPHYELAGEGEGEAYGGRWRTRRAQRADGYGSGYGDGGSGYECGPWDSDAGLGRYLRRARAAGIARSALLAAFHSDYAQANAEVARMVAARPQQFYAYAFVHAVRDRGRIAAMVGTA